MKIAYVLLLSFLVTGWLRAEKQSINSNGLKDKRINVKSEGGMSLKTEGQKASFYKNVLVSMGNLIMNCQQLDVEYQEGKNNKLEAKTLRGTGKVFCEEKEKNIKAWCDEVIYDHKSEIMTVSSDKLSKVIKDDQVFESKSFDIFLKTGELKVKGRSTIEISLE